MELLDTYVKTGPSKEELSDGPSLANWAILKGASLPELRRHDGLRKGDWREIWTPLTAVLEKEGFRALRPLQVLTMYEETSREPARFVRLLGSLGYINPQEPKSRNRGRDLRHLIGEGRLKISPIRTTMRFASAGWDYTATASLEPGNRLIRLAVRGSQPCKISGSDRITTLNLKGRLFENLDSPSGMKVQVIDSQFSNTGCELKLIDRINTTARLAGGGEAKVSGSLSLLIRDESISGRFQLDLVSKQAGVALLTGRAVYSLRGKLDKSGDMSITMVSVSASGSRVLRQELEKNGQIVGNLTGSVGTGHITLPVLKDPLNWHHVHQEQRASRGK